MGPTLILETTFLVDLEREARSRSPGGAHRFLDAHADSVFEIALTTAGELAAGAGAGERRSWEALLRPFRVLPPDREVAWRHGQIYAFLQRNGLLIGANDLWIAATALSVRAPVVTRDVEHYRRVPELEVIEY